MHSSSVLQSIDPTTHRNNADRYYRTNEVSGYVQDKWQALTNLSITAGVRYDYHGGMTEKYGDMFNFNPALYNVTGTTTTGFNVEQFRIRHRREQQAEPDKRRFRLHPERTPMGHLASRRLRLVSQGQSIASWSSAAAAVCTTTAENSFSYLSQPAGGSIGGPFGVTESSPLVSVANGNTDSSSVLPWKTQWEIWLSAPRRKVASIRRQAQTLVLSLRLCRPP